ncbi:GAF domain-containing protein [Streptomyces sp. NPDC087440]|uniref:GAF domain-containing protein n=1 Tax=Streptomyces sp. NPDC087440 TaxID=3365790 RepID=UPI00380E2ADE
MGTTQSKAARYGVTDLLLRGEVSEQGLVVREVGRTEPLYGQGWATLGPAACFSVTAREGRDTTLRVSGELDLACLHSLARLLRALGSTPRRLALDLGQVGFCSPDALDLMARAAQQLRSLGGQLVVVSAPSQVLRTLRLSGGHPGLPVNLTPVGLFSRDDYRHRQALLRDALALTLRITGAPMGNAQLLDPETGLLHLTSQRGFHQPFLAFFATVEDRDTACGVAALDRVPVFVEEVAASPVFLGTPALDAVREAGVGAVVSLPVTTRQGVLIGVISVHHRTATLWTPAQRRTLVSLAGATGQLLDPAGHAGAAPPLRT